jgi:molybdopterin biosynthesis enzyme
MVQRRLRETRARLVAARRSGDTRYALKLRAMVASLEADAAKVDGRAFSAADRPGTLRCGHELAAGCACPRRASTRGQR